jgi:D-tagatose-bisphosphate aldolase class II non-catalytic subunit
MISRGGLRSIIADNRAGGARGVASWCTAHAETLRVILRAHSHGDDLILIEATCNQVNQHGGYTGMTPARFRTFIEELADEADIDIRRIILGGDHLGPNPWKGQRAAEAMAEARDMVRAYVEAGFDKIHLDASMACADDDALSEDRMAERAAELCEVAESARGMRQLLYVIGTEVPVPGGETEVLDALAVTRPEAALRTFDLHRSAFARRGLGDALSRVIGFVVQPGVDFGNAQVFAYDPARAAELSRTVFDFPAAVFEAHSTDYQTEASLRALVASHFAILKVGPELTFAYRQAVVTMAHVERYLSVSRPSNILDIIHEEMTADPKYWRDYIAADTREDAMRLFGLSDRIRYYWPKPRIAAALQRLYDNIDNGHPEIGIMSQFIPSLDTERAEQRSLSSQIIRINVGAVVAKYRRATQPAAGTN